jgi:hypothetical protein
VKNFESQTTNPSRIALPIAPVSGHTCVLGMAFREAAIVRDGGRTGAVMGLTTAYKGAFPGLDAWSPPI